MDKVFVRGLKTDCIIGILPEERVKPQRLVVDLELKIPLWEAGVSADLDKSVDYAKLSQRVKDYVQKRRANLLEELAVELCELINKEFHVSGVTVRLAKPQAVAYADAAGIEISRTYNGD